LNQNAPAKKAGPAINKKHRNQRKRALKVDHGLGLELLWGGILSMSL